MLLAVLLESYLRQGLKARVVKWSDLYIWHKGNLHSAYRTNLCEPKIIESVDHYAVNRWIQGEDEVQFGVPQIKLIYTRRGGMSVDFLLLSFLELQEMTSENIFWQDVFCIFALREILIFLRVIDVLKRHYIHVPYT